jgi:hypothetical protein
VPSSCLLLPLHYWTTGAAARGKELSLGVPGARGDEARFGDEERRNASAVLGAASGGGAHLPGLVRSGGGRYAAVTSDPLCSLRFS